MWMFYEYLRRNVEGEPRRKKYPLGGAFCNNRHFDKLSNEKVDKINCYNENMT